VKLEKVVSKIPEKGSENGSQEKMQMLSCRCSIWKNV